MVLVYISAVPCCRVPARNSSPLILPLNLAHISCIYNDHRVPARNLGSCSSTIPAIEFLQETPTQWHCFMPCSSFCCVRCRITARNLGPPTCFRFYAATYMPLCLLHESPARRHRFRFLLIFLLYSLYSSCTKLQLINIAAGSCSYFFFVSCGVPARKYTVTTLLQVLAHFSSLPAVEFLQESPAWRHCFRFLLILLLYLLESSRKKLQPINTASGSCSPSYYATVGFCNIVQHDDIASDSWSSFFFARCRISARNSSQSKFYSSASSHWKLFFGFWRWMSEQKRKGKKEWNKRIATVSGQYIRNFRLCKTKNRISLKP